MVELIVVGRRPLLPYHDGIGCDRTGAGSWRQVPPPPWWADHTRV